MGAPDMAHPIGVANAAAVRLTYADGLSRNVFTTDVEAPFPDGRLIVSRADLAGLITHVNDALVEISGWSREELMGAPHHILRHPDMPRRVFQDMWDTVAQGKKWHGYVKNLCRDGAYYWVFATAVPNIRGGQCMGYTSVRRKPSRTCIAVLLPLYRQWLEQEKAAA